MVNAIFERNQGNHKIYKTEYNEKYSFNWPIENYDNCWKQAVADSSFSQPDYWFQSAGWNVRLTAKFSGVYFSKVVRPRLISKYVTLGHHWRVGVVNLVQKLTVHLLHMISYRKIERWNMHREGWEHVWNVLFNILWITTKKNSNKYYKFDFIDLLIPKCRFALKCTSCSWQSI